MWLLEEVHLLLTSEAYAACVFVRIKLSVSNQMLFGVIMSIGKFDMEDILELS